MLALRIRALERRHLTRSTSTVFQTARLHVSTGWREKVHNASNTTQKNSDPRLSEVDDLIEDRFAVLKSQYDVPKHPIILAHGLLGFDELHLGGKFLPGIEYWYGITQALASKGVEVITSAVPASGSIEKRAEKLAAAIEKQAGGKAVNIIAYVGSRNLIPDTVY